ncbi:hypothetical protein CPLU01_15697 [Colletotrichum plurivorum]|uniref:DUF7708 domain-containing protein n=1 Tax=Colletotrichum plurivorum TaxID=2175906 RepID=A0A8H6J830_9PEZI|nr:hypothetical protein CPLU01_15697 [Colletotrichum plurivorum]
MSPGTTDVAEDAYRAAKSHFERSGSLSDEDKKLISRGSCIEDVQLVVADSLAKYEARSGSSKTKKWLQKASETICHYGTVLDVFVQHHPEYISLAWGTMKLLFVTVVNHAETLKLVSKSIAEVGIRLPRIKIISTIYPTTEMRLAVGDLYSCVLEFLLIAHAWCNESKLRHVYHSFTRPHKLQYDDLLQRIADGSNNIIELAVVGSQAEIRVMHTTQAGKLEAIISILEEADKDCRNQLKSLAHVVSRLGASNKEHGKKLELIISLFEASGLTINDLVTKMETFQSIQTSAQLDTNQRLADLQLSQAMATLLPTFDDPEKCYKHHLFWRNRRSSGMGVKTSTNEFWLSPRLARWSSSSKSSIVVIKGPFPSRSAIVDFSVDIIQTLEASAVPTLWALTSFGKSGPKSMSTTTDLLKYLTYQALRIGGSLKTEKELSLRYSQFLTARKPEEWLALFMQVIESLGDQTYVVIDLATVLSSLDGADGFNLIQELSRVVGHESRRETKTKLKVAFLVYETDWFRVLPGDAFQDTISVKLVKTKHPQGKSRRQAVTRRLVTR